MLILVPWWKFRGQKQFTLFGRWKFAIMLFTIVNTPRKEIQLFPVEEKPITDKDVRVAVGDVIPTVRYQ